MVITLMSGRSNCTTAPICGTPAESRTTPVTDPGAAPKTGTLAIEINAKSETSWSLRIITRVGDPAASWQISWESFPRGSPDLLSGNQIAGRSLYSTTKGADCAISCLEIVSFILIVTLYLPG